MLGPSQTVISSAREACHGRFRLRYPCPGDRPERHPPPAPDPAGGAAAGRGADHPSARTRRRPSAPSIGSNGAPPSATASSATTRTATTRTPATRTTRIRTTRRRALGHPATPRSASRGVVPGGRAPRGRAGRSAARAEPPARRVRTGRSVLPPATSAPAAPRSRGSRSARSTRISISMSAARPQPAVPATASPASERSPVFAPGRSSVFLGRQRRSVRRMRIVISMSIPARPASSWGVERAARLAVPAMSAARNRAPSGQHGRRPGGARGGPRVRPRLAHGAAACGGSSGIVCRSHSPYGEEVADGTSFPCGQWLYPADDRLFGRRHCPQSNVRAAFLPFR